MPYASLHVAITFIMGTVTTVNSRDFLVFFCSGNASQYVLENSVRGNET